MSPTHHITITHQGEDHRLQHRTTPELWRRPLVLAAAAVGTGALIRSAIRRRAPATTDEAAPELVRSAVVGDIVMRWEEHGTDGSEAVPVVFVHGIPTNPRLWRFVIPALRERGVRCIAWEMVGFGWSIPEGLDRDISVARQSQYLDAFLHHLGVDEAILVGHDLGGGVVQRFAVTHPDRCLGLVLADSVAFDNWPVAAVRGARAMNRVVERLPAALLEPFLTAALGQLGHDDARRHARSTELHVRPYRTAVGPAGLAHQLRSLEAADTRAVSGKLEALDVPARVIWGDHDPLGVASGERLARALAAPLHVIPGARHFTPEDHPDVVAGAIDEVVREVRRRESAGLPGAEPGDDAEGMDQRRSADEGWGEVWGEA